MKFIFLDFDGVLNSDNYYRINGNNAPFIDVSRMPILKRIVDESGALIVLSTSWREHWDSDALKCDSIGRYINEIFAANGLFIYGKTPQLNIERVKEIQTWLEEYPITESFVILDDSAFGWGELEDNFVRIKYYRYGLDEGDAEKAIKILNG